MNLLNYNIFVLFYFILLVILKCIKNNYKYDSTIHIPNDIYVCYYMTEFHQFYYTIRLNYLRLVHIIFYQI